MYHSLRTTLYHGTASEIQQIDVKLGRERKVETNEYLCEACDREREDGIDVLYEFINS